MSRVLSTAIKEYRGPIRKKPLYVGAPANSIVPLSVMIPRPLKMAKSAVKYTPSAGRLSKFTVGT